MTISLAKVREATDIMKNLDAKHATLTEAVNAYMGEREVAAGALAFITGEPVEAVLAQLPAVPRGRKVKAAPIEPEEHRRLEPGTPDALPRTEGGPSGEEGAPHAGE